MLLPAELFGRKVQGVDENRVFTRRSVLFTTHVNYLTGLASVSFTRISLSLFPSLFLPPHLSSRLELRRSGGLPGDENAKDMPSAKGYPVADASHALREAVSILLLDL